MNKAREQMVSDAFWRRILEMRLRATLTGRAPAHPKAHTLADFHKPPRAIQ